MRNLVLYFFVIINIMSCNQQTTKTSIQSGDILFRGTSHAGLSEAINKVTQTDSSTNYTHIGVCEMIDDTVWVYHSAPEKGVCREDSPRRPTDDR